MKKDYYEKEGIEIKDIKFKISLLEIDDKLKQDTIKLINNGQLQMNLGGWCMNDGLLYNYKINI